MMVDGNTIEVVEELLYLGSVHSTSGRCYPDVHRRIGLASSAIHSMQRCWRQQRLSLHTKLRFTEPAVYKYYCVGLKHGYFF